MDNIIKQLKNGAKHTKLSFSEKAAIRHTLLAHVKQNPPPKNIFENYSIPSPFSIGKLGSKKVTAGIVIVGLLLSGSVSFAAENALPGDMLFAVKTNINEKVRGAVAVTPKAKAEWEVRLVERRIEEVEKITNEENASAEKIALEEEYFDKYSKKVNERIKKLEENENKDDAILTAEHFSQMLLTHEDFNRNSKNKDKEKFNSNEDDRTFEEEGLSDPVTEDDEDIAEELTFKNVIRETRGEVDKKHKEMKEKYDTEEGVSNDREKKSTRKERIQSAQRENSQKEGTGVIREEIRSHRDKDVEKGND